MTRRRTATVLAALAAVANCSFVLETAVGSHLAWSTSMVSELSVAGQPGAWVFRAGDLVAGALACVVAVLLPRGRRVTAWLAASLLVFGAGTLVSALLPLTCSPSADPSCPWADRTGQDVVHDGLSVLGTTAALGGFALLWWTLRARRDGPAARRRSRAAGAIALSSSLLGLVQADFLLPHVPLEAGWMQRVQIVVVSAGLLAVAAWSPADD